MDCNIEERPSLRALAVSRECAGKGCPELPDRGIFLAEEKSPASNIWGLTAARRRAVGSVMWIGETPIERFDIFYENSSMIF